MRIFRSLHRFPWAPYLLWRHLYGSQKGWYHFKLARSYLCKRRSIFSRSSKFYRRFIPGFAKLAHPLHHLLKKNVKFSWSPDAQAAFDSLKLKFTSSPVLIYPNRELPFIVETDSCNFAIGAVLSQSFTPSRFLF